MYISEDEIDNKTPKRKDSSALRYKSTFDTSATMVSLVFSPCPNARMMEMLLPASEYSVSTENGFAVTHMNMKISLQEGVISTDDSSAQR